MHARQGATPDLSGRVRAVDAAFPLDDLARRSCYSGLQPGVTKRIGTAARRKALVILQLSCFAGLQLEVAKRVVTAHNVVFQHSAAFALCGFAGGGCKMQCAGCAKRIVLQKPHKRYLGSISKQ